MGVGVEGGPELAFPGHGTVMTPGACIRLGRVAELGAVLVPGTGELQHVCPVCPICPWPPGLLADPKCERAGVLTLLPPFQLPVSSSHTDAAGLARIFGTSSHPSFRTPNYKVMRKSPLLVSAAQARNSAPGRAPRAAARRLRVFSATSNSKSQGCSLTTYYGLTANLFKPSLNLFMFH